MTLTNLRWLNWRISKYFRDKACLLRPMMIFGAIAIVLYSPILSKVPALSEVLAGTGLGMIVPRNDSLFPNAMPASINGFI
jgi:hypothetical protein